MSLSRIFLIAILLHTQLPAQVKESQVADPLAASRQKQEWQRAADPVTKSSEILISSLCTLSIGPDAVSAYKIRPSSEQRISLNGFSPAQQEKIKKSLQKWINQPVSLDSLDQMARAAEKAASFQAESLITATYPPQEITGGHIVMVLSEPLLSQLTFAGKPRFGKDFLRRAILTRPGGIASAESIRKDLDFLNRNPFRKATALWSPVAGDIPAANLIIHINEKRPWNLYTGFDNYASEPLGDERFYLGGKFGNVFDLDHRFGWLLLSTADGKSLHAANLSYEMPLPSHRILSFSSGVSESTTTTPSSLIDNNGAFFHFRSMVEQPLPDWKNLRHHWKTGFSYRENQYRSNGNHTDISIFQIENLWEGELHDGYGFTAFSAGLFCNPGSTFVSSDDSIYQSLGATDSDSWVTTFKAERNVALNRFGKLAFTTEAQWTHENLIPSNQFAGGGARRIRGYDEGDVFFDKAMMLSTEWQWQRINLPQNMNLRPHLFIDGGWFGDHQSASEFLSSVGLGFEFSCRNHYSGKLELAQPIQNYKNANRSPVFYFSINTFW